MVLVQGNNGHGKSNLLEAVYLLVIAKSQRASTERELVRRESVGVEFFSQVAAVVQREDGPVRVQVDFKNTVSETNRGDAEERLNVQKYVRVNGIPRRASELVGEINAVMFSAQDLDMVYGSPGLRRRYMDILISQVDREYLRAVQRYQRVVVQRNHLLKGIRGGRSRPSDLEFWDGELVKSGGVVVARRREALDALSDGAARTHATLTDDGEALELAYRPSIAIDKRHTPDDIGKAMHEALVQVRSREIAQGLLSSGAPSRRLPASSQRHGRRTLRIARTGEDGGARPEAGRGGIPQRRPEPAAGPAARRRALGAWTRLVDASSLERVSNYSHRCSSPPPTWTVIEPEYLARMTRFVVNRGRLERVNG